MGIQVGGDVWNGRLMLEHYRVNRMSAELYTKIAVELLEMRWNRVSLVRQVVVTNRRGYVMANYRSEGNSPLISQPLADLPA